MASAARRPEGFLAIQSARGSPDWPSALISLSMSYSTRRIESVAPSIKRYDANLPTMICANGLAPAVLFSIGCAGLPSATHRCCDPCAAATSEISPSHSPTGSGRMTGHPETTRPVLPNPAPGSDRLPESAFQTPSCSAASAHWPKSGLLFDWPPDCGPRRSAPDCPQPTAGIQPPGI